MLRWCQVQAVADKVAGREAAVVRPGDLEEPWATLYARVKRAPDLELAERVVWRAAMGLEERQKVVEQVLAALPPAEGYRRFPSLAVAARSLAPVEWLWPGWIPRGMLSVLGGAAGAGKSLVALPVARR